MTTIKNDGVKRVIETMIRDCDGSDFYRRDINIKNQNLVQSVLEFLLKYNIIKFEIGKKQTRLYSWNTVLTKLDINDLSYRANQHFNKEEIELEDKKILIDDKLFDDELFGEDIEDDLFNEYCDLFDEKKAFNDIENNTIREIIEKIIKDHKDKGFYRSDVKIKYQTLLQSVLDFFIKENILEFKKHKGVRLYTWKIEFIDINFNNLIDLINIEFPNEDNDNITCKEFLSELSSIRNKKEYYENQHQIFINKHRKIIEILSVEV